MCENCVELACCPKDAPPGTQGKWLAKEISLHQFEDCLWYDWSWGSIQNRAVIYVGFYPSGIFNCLWQALLTLANTQVLMEILTATLQECPVSVHSPNQYSAGQCNIDNVFESETPFNSRNLTILLVVHAGESGL